MTTGPDRLSRIRGSFYGLALGDALGARTEFINNLPAILQMFPPAGPTLDIAPEDGTWMVTDDTQMTLAVARAVVRVQKEGAAFSADTLRQPLIDAFVEWAFSKENFRSPGMTCMNACFALARNDRPWTKCTVARSKGCGANMRVAPVAYVAGLDAPTFAGIAQFQAALTHGHPTGLAAAELTALAVADMMNGGDPGGLLDRLESHADTQRTVYHEAWLGDLWKEMPAPSTDEFANLGWVEAWGALATVRRALDDRKAATNPTWDVCRHCGGGWIAESALACAVACAMIFADDPPKALWRGAVSSGDSDSIACITGAILGAHHGMDAWPADAIATVEYRDEIEALCEALA